VPTNDINTNWLVGTEASDTYPKFGTGVYGTKSGNLVSFKAGHETYEDWLTAYYERTRPLVKTPEESKALAPTHFIVTYGTTTTEWTIDYWNQYIAIAETVTAKSTAIIRFIRRTASGDLQLAYAAALIKSIA